MGGTKGQLLFNSQNQKRQSSFTLLCPRKRFQHIARLNSRKVGYMGERKKLIFGPKKGLYTPPRSLPSNMRNIKILSFWCPVGMLTKILEDVQKEVGFGPKKGHFGQPGPWNGPSRGQTVTYRKTEGIQSYPRIWGTYDPIESDPSVPKKGGLYGCSVKKCRFSLLDIFWP